jgi:formate dehydrogenase accessory protein FdhD
MDLHDNVLPSGGTGAGKSRRAQDNGFVAEKQNTPIVTLITSGRGNSGLVADHHFRHFSGMADTDPENPAMIIAPDPDAPGLSQPVTGVDESGAPVTLPVVTEKPLTLFLNRQEIVTSMTIGDWPAELAVGYFLNQNMLHDDDVITGIDHDDDLGVVIVRTERETDFEAKMKRKIRTSGCAEGTAYGDMMERFDSIRLNPDMRLHASMLIPLSKAINTTPSLYLSAGAIHGCVLCSAETPLVYMEDIGRHNAVDKIADGADAHPCAGLALRLYQRGGGTGAAGRTDTDRPRQGQAVHRAERRGQDRLRRGRRRYGGYRRYPVAAACSRA